MKSNKNKAKKIVLFLAILSFLLTSCSESENHESANTSTNEDISSESDFSQNITSDEPESSSNVEDLSADISEYASEYASEYVSEDISEYASEDISEDISENASEDVSEDVSEDISEDVSEDISEDEPTVTIETAAERFADHFTDEEVIFTENEYKSNNVHITFEEITFENKLYFVQDIYITDIECLSTGFAGGSYQSGKYNDYVFNMTENYRENGYNIIGSINGDYCRLNSKGATIRNGVLYGKGIAERTVCVLYKNGVMKTIPKNKFNAEKELEKGAWHVWDFGPSFLDKDGNALTTFTDRPSISGSNPRAVIGYFEPGHYCFVVAGGRKSPNAYGVTYSQISRFLSSIGCKVAYNLDGGESAVMVYGDDIVNSEYQGTGRRNTDFVFIQDIKNQAEEQ